MYWIVSKTIINLYAHVYLYILNGKCHRLHVSHAPYHYLVIKVLFLFALYMYICGTIPLLDI